MAHFQQILKGVFFLRQKAFLLDTNAFLPIPQFWIALCGLCWCPNYTRMYERLQFKGSQPFCVQLISCGITAFQPGYSWSFGARTFLEGGSVFFSAMANIHYITRVCFFPNRNQQKGAPRRRRYVAVCLGSIGSLRIWVHQQVKRNVMGHQLKPGVWQPTNLQQTYCMHVYKWIYCKIPWTD